MHQSGKAPIDFGVKIQQSKSQVRVVYICVQICFQMITSVWINQIYSKS